MATGAPDANGIWIYGEDDSEPTFSALLNKLGTSTSTQVANIKQAGRVLNTVSAAKRDTFTTTSATFTTVTGLSVTITPKATTSKILVIAQIARGWSSTNGLGHFKVVRNGADIYQGDSAPNRISAVFGGFSNVGAPTILTSESIVYLDSPSTTSAVTYAVQCRIGASGAVLVNRSEFDGSDANVARGASSITVMEIAG